jgi:hypothetical protein
LSLASFSSLITLQVTDFCNNLDKVHWTQGPML